MCIIENWKGDLNLYLTVVNGINRTIQHPCQKNNGDCSHLCLLSGKTKVHYSIILLIGTYITFCS